VTKETVAEGWEPEDSPMYVYRISNEMQDFKDKLNVNHDLVVSNPNRQRVKNRAATMEEYYDNRVIIGIVEAFIPVQEALTKTMKTLLPKSGKNLKVAFDTFL
jgi:hypothetical protein